MHVMLANPKHSNAPRTKAVMLVHPKHSNAPRTKAVSLLHAAKIKVACDKGGSKCISTLLKLTRCAKKELLKEKIKANLEKKAGAKLDKVADLLVDAMIEEHKASGVDKERRAELQAR
jgi:hypothetical protein